MQDTIAALATAPVKGAVGVLRISGQDSARIAAEVFKSKRKLEDNPRNMLYGDFLASDGQVLDRGLAVFFKAPSSYTGEDTVEFYCHGSVTVLGELLNALYKSGARPAKPGEYTRRAFLNGKIDLTQAEAVIDLIDAESAQAAKNAAAQLEGVMGGAIGQVRAPLVDIASEFYAYVDYPDDEIEVEKIEKNIEILSGCADRLSRLAESYEKGRLLRDGVTCAIVGRPNVGKSSVLNALLGYDRSIVTDIAGTTRDTVEESLSIGGVKLRLIDTAGIHMTDDVVEKQGVERAIKAIEKADLILAVFDSSRLMDEEDLNIIKKCAGRCAVAVANKTDLAAMWDDGVLDSFGDKVCRVSAKSGDGIDCIEQIIKDVFAVDSIPCAGETVTNPRHAYALRTAAEHIRTAADTLSAGLTPDVAVSDVESALNALEELTGQSASEQVLTRIFERFCVGK